MSNLSDSDYERLALRLEELMQRVDLIPYPDVNDVVRELLRGLDALHREALARMLDLVDAEAPGLMDRFEKDFALRTLLMLYDFFETPDADAAGGNGFVARDDVDVLDAFGRPVWIPAGRLDDLRRGDMRAREFEGVSVLFCRIADEVFAVRNMCPGSILPLVSGSLDGAVITCPWHGCRFDARSGEPVEVDGDALETFPVEIGDDGRFSVGFNIRIH